jgi:hypothetical protein
MLFTVVLLVCVVLALLLKVNAHGRKIASLESALWQLTGGAERAAHESEWAWTESALDEEEAAMAKEAEDAAKAR